MFHFSSTQQHYLVAEGKDQIQCLFVWCSLFQRRQNTRYHLYDAPLGDAVRLVYIEGTAIVKKINSAYFGNGWACSFVEPKL